MIFHSDLPWISDTQDGGGDILQDGPPEEEEPGDGKARIGRSHLCGKMESFFCKLK